MINSSPAFRPFPPSCLCFAMSLSAFESLCLSLSLSLSLYLYVSACTPSLILPFESLSISLFLFRIFLHTNVRVYRGSASSADLFVCTFVRIKYGIRVDLLCVIWFASKFCIQPICTNIISVILVFPCFLQHAKRWIMPFWYWWLHNAPYDSYRFIKMYMAAVFLRFEFVFIDFSMISSHLVPEGWPGCGPL